MWGTALGDRGETERNQRPHAAASETMASTHWGSRYSIVILIGPYMEQYRASHREKKLSRLDAHQSAGNRIDIKGKQIEAP